MACVSVDGLVAVCAAHGHGDHLLVLCSDSSSYSCPFRSFLHLVQHPDNNRDNTLYQSLDIVNSNSAWWFGERSLLSLFGAQHREHPERLVQSVINNAPNSQNVRCLWDTKSRKLLP